MEILESTKQYRGAPCAVAMGMFDGMHVGHRALIARTREEALARSAPLVIYTYADHPLSVLQPQNIPSPLMDVEEKLHIMEQLGVDTVILNRFTSEMAKTPPVDFLRELCKNLKPVLLAAGRNHSFGYRGEGNADLLRKMACELGYEALILEPIEQDGSPISSSRIRKLLREGQVQEAQKLLGGGQENIYSGTKPRPAVAEDDLESSRFSLPTDHCPLSAKSH